METKRAVDKKIIKRLEPLNGNIAKLPFLSIETDGNPFPQILEARIETFSLQVERLKKQFLAMDGKSVRV
jgi:hypothetical protein